MNKRLPPPCVVTIAGTDPSGGAGIQADIKAISATGSYAASIITALVAQNTQGVQAIQEVPTPFVRQQFDSVFQDLPVKAVKIGMLHHQQMIDTVSKALEHYRPAIIVFDPVMVAKNGCALIDPTTIDFLKERLLQQCSVITPNIPEAEKLLNRTITSRAAMGEAAATLGQQFQLDVLVKGGHFASDEAADVLYVSHTKQLHWFHQPRVPTHNTHGTGCSLSAAIASYLAQNFTLVEAIATAKRYLTQAIQAGSQLQLGQGHGPVDHFYFLTGEMI